MMPERDPVRTGISGLDSILAGGIPRANVILVEGGVGTGKTTLGVEFVYRGASEFGEPGIIVLFEVSPDKLARDAATFGWDLPALEREKRLRIVFTTRPIFRQELQQADSLLLEEAAEMGARRIFVDGVVGGGGGGAELREAFQVLIEGLQREQLTAVLAVEGQRVGRGPSCMTVLPRRLPAAVPGLPFSAYEALISRAPTRRPPPSPPGARDEGE